MIFLLGVGVAPEQSRETIVAFGANSRHFLFFHLKREIFKGVLDYFYFLEKGQYAKSVWEPLSMCTGSCGLVHLAW